MWLNDLLAWGKAYGAEFCLFRCDANLDPKMV